MSGIVAGVDGCRGGWICVTRDLDAPKSASVAFYKSFAELVGVVPAPSVIAIDIPIGFPARIEGAGRACDEAARHVLGKRGSSVFAAPARSVLSATDYRAACAAALASSEPPRQITIYMFNLFPKIKEVDAEMTPALQARVFECHPEVAFWLMNGKEPLAEPKKLKGRAHADGLALRRGLLAAHGFDEKFLSSSPFPKSVAGSDDFLDACACAWSAERILRGKAIRFPENPPLDEKGLRMEICA